MNRNLVLLFLIIVLVISTCTSRNQVKNAFENKTQKIEDKYVPDPSLDMLSAEIEYDNNQWILRGETTVPEAKTELIAFTDSLFGENNYKNEFVELPHPNLGDSTYGIVMVSVANLRENPRHSAQLVDQAIMGNILRLLKNDGGWYLIQTEYDYIGWMRRESFVRTDESGVSDWQKSKRVRVKKLFALVRSERDENATPVTDVVLNSLLYFDDQTRNWVKVATPDGRTGYLKHEAVTTDLSKVPAGNTRDSIIKTAKGMMGIPYLWGGNSTKGNDCSGFTQTVFKRHHIQVPRDARQQALVGEEINPDENFSNVKPGDLLFFGSSDRITHVGISLGGPEFIHQSGRVHINSLDPDADNFSAYRKRTLRKITRVIN